MSEASESAKIAFAPHLGVRIIDDRRILLLSENRSFLLTGKLYVAAAPYLDGSRTRDEIIAALKSTTAAPEDRIALAMATLLDKRYVTAVASDVPAPRAAFWGELGVDAAGAEHMVQRTRVAVRPLGTLPGADAPAAEALRAALSEAGFTATDDAPAADLTIVLVDDYLDPMLDAVNREMRTTARAWLPLKATGRVAWIGPLFRVGEGPCLACLTKRVKENRPEEAWVTDGDVAHRLPRSTFPPFRTMAVNLAALELARVTAAAPESALAQSNLLTFDMLDVGVVRHVVHRQPACAVCGAQDAAPAEGRPLSLTPRRKHPTADGGSRTCSAEEVLDRLASQVSPLTGLVSGLVNQSPAEGLPVYGTRQIYAVAIGPRANRIMGRADGASGKGTTEVQAKVSCLAEAVERYSTGWQGLEPRRHATLSELGEAAVPPNELMLYSTRQFAARETWNQTTDDFNWIGAPFLPERAIDWTPFWSLSHERVRWLPTQFCYFNYHGDVDHDFCKADSNGCASGSTLEEAILQGFMELVERDSCALWWYNRLQRPPIDLTSFDDPFFPRAEAYLRGKGRNLYALDLTSDLGIPVVVAMSHAGGRKIVCGLGAHLSVRVAASRAVAELHQMLVRETVEGAESPPTHADPVLVRWLREATIENQPYVLPASTRALTPADFPTVDNDDLLADIEHCVASVRRRGLEMLVLDTTRAEVGFPTVRVSVPGLRHFWARFAPGRLYDVPLALGWLDRRLDELELNPIPFFL